MEETDAQLQLKKRARRRLVGAIAFVVAVAVVLPMIMDQEPKPAIQEVDIRIPGQDEKPFAPKFAAAPAEKPAPKAAPEKQPEVEKPQEKPGEKPADKAPPAEPAKPVEPTAKVVDKPATEKTADKPAAKPEKAPEKPAEKPPVKPEKPTEKPTDKPADKNADKAKAGDAEAKRAAAILAGGQAAAPSHRGGEHVILIGAFTNEANVKNLRAKLNELGIKSYTEPLESPQGRKTRVRAGPFTDQESADRALEKMKKIGVSGVVTAK